jgi:transposase-like protein
MPWQERTKMEERAEFVTFAQREDANIAALCREAKISRKTGYTWLARAVSGEQDWSDRSRRPHTSPDRTLAAVEAQIVALRQAHPAWGGRKLHHWLVQHGHADVPAPSTITDIVRRTLPSACTALSTRPPMPWYSSTSWAIAAWATASASIP